MALLLSKGTSVASGRGAADRPAAAAGRSLPTVSAALLLIAGLSVAVSVFAQSEKKSPRATPQQKQPAGRPAAERPRQGDVLPPTEKNLPARRDEPQGWDAWRESRKEMSGFFERGLYRLGRDMEASGGNREPSAAPSSAEVKGTGKPATVPVTKGYKNWELGMRRRELQRLVQLWTSWMPDVGKNEPALALVNYVTVVFDDGEVVKFAVGPADPPKTSGSPDARVYRIEVGYDLMQLDVERQEIPFMELLDKAFGEPTRIEIRTRGTIGRPPLSQRDRAFLDALSKEDFFYYARGTQSIFTAVTQQMWCWPDADVDVTCTLEAYPTLQYAAWLEYDQGLRARGRMRQAAETDAARKQREAEKAALRGLGESLPPKRRGE